MKFRKGDRVVILSCEDSKHFEIGDSAVLSSLSFMDGVVWVTVEKNQWRHCFYESELEYELVYNSPLYEALL